MRTVHIINGPNLNMLGAREPEIYGATAFEELIEVHISNTYAREDFRQRDVLAPVCEGVIIGMGLDGYRLALANLSSRRV